MPLIFVTIGVIITLSERKNMKLWLAVSTADADNPIALGIVEAGTENEAMYQFMGIQIYPSYVVECSKFVVSKDTYDAARYDFYDPYDD
jgi:hypothetical protein